ncbi:MAG: hypothetical protein KatS3mg082_2534 [Nitrospiraceae bacterium]|nr:MAG: hypothetical protein KatS3mg082_2534 [Nitrospiraceae bacterium]
MAEKGIRHLVVTDEGQIVGILSVRDLLPILQELGDVVIPHPAPIPVRTRPSDAMGPHSYMTTGPDSPRSSTVLLLVTALISGAVVMALEMLGSRLLAPVFGNSLYVWGALIGVILGGDEQRPMPSAGGYRIDSPARRSWHGFCCFSGGWTFLLAWSGHPVMFKVAALTDDPRWGPCLAASFLLAPPAFGLSGVLPALLRLAVKDMGYLGRHAGRMIAVSTVGSLAGTWGTAFFLLSLAGNSGADRLVGRDSDCARVSLVRARGCVQNAVRSSRSRRAVPSGRIGGSGRAWRYIVSNNCRSPCIRKTVPTSRSACGMTTCFAI